MPPRRDACVRMKDQGGWCKPAGSGGGGGGGGGERARARDRAARG